MAQVLNLEEPHITEFGKHDMYCLSSLYVYCLSCLFTLCYHSHATENKVQACLTFFQSRESIKTMWPCATTDTAHAQRSYLQCSATWAFSGLLTDGGKKGFPP